VPTTEEGLREFYVFSDFPHFLDVYRVVSRLLSEPEDIAELVRGIGRDLAAQNVRYVELQVAPYPFQGLGMPDAVISEALSVGARDALARHGVRIAYIVDFPGHDAEREAGRALRFALDSPPDGLIGVGIGGDEARRAPYTDVIRDVFEAAYRAGLRCVPHAGETTGADTVWEAIEFLHAERIGHGIRSLDDPSLVSYLAERQLPVDVSPTSNVCTRCVPSIAAHPLRRMVEAGLYVTLNSDDPPMFGTSLNNEYLVAGHDLGFLALDAEAFGKSPKKSIDYAVMERTRHAAVVPADIGWSDVGNWDAVWKLSARDARGNSIWGEGLAIESDNVHVRSTGLLTAVVGVRDLIVVTTQDAVLVLARDQGDKVKQLVENLRESKRREATEHKRMYRPWGYYQSVDEGARYQVKRIVVTPGHRLSLQRHFHRAEHWVVVTGTAEVTRGEEKQIVHENESIFLPIGVIHRLANPGKINLELIEVQTGSYLGEDDIVRIEDVYNRVEK